MNHMPDVAVKHGTKSLRRLRSHFPWRSKKNLVDDWTIRFTLTCIFSKRFKSSGMESEMLTSIPWYPLFSRCILDCPSGWQCNPDTRITEQSKTLRHRDMTLYLGACILRCTKKWYKMIFRGWVCLLEWQRMLVDPKTKISYKLVNGTD